MEHHDAPEMVELALRSVIPGGDPRRLIQEVTFSDCSLQDFMITSENEPLGQHFHLEKFEVFYCLEGGGKIRTAKVAEGGLSFDENEVEEWEFGPGAGLFIPPGHTHRFDLRPGTRMIAFSSKPFDQSDMIGCPISLSE